jgi:hypothetical protein
MMSAALAGLAGVLLTITVTVWKSRTDRRGRARLLHEDLLRMQSTIGRLCYQSAAEGKWGERAWVLTRLAEPEAQQDVLAHASRWWLPEPWRFSACASALGWAEYLREAYGSGTAPSDVELRKIYGRLAAGRLAVARLASIDYWPHDPQGLFHSRRRTPAVELDKIGEPEARREAMRYSTEIAGAKPWPSSPIHVLLGPLRHVAGLPAHVVSLLR